MLSYLYIQTLHEDRMRGLRNEHQVREARHAAQPHAGRVWPRLLALGHRRHANSRMVT
jgi:hypothetical protein